ncbi:MAG: chemotaxis protein CheC [Actinomycetota bacterium]
MSTETAGPGGPSAVDSLTAAQLDALREVGNIGAGNAATSLSRMVGHPVAMTVPCVRAVPLHHVPAAVAGDDEAVIVAIHLGVLGDAHGHIMFVMTVDDAKEIAASALQGMHPGDPDLFGLGDMERSALGEIGNILTSAYLIAMTTVTGLRLEPSPPQLGVDMAAALIGDVLTDVAATGNTALLIETEFEEVDDPVCGTFLFIPTADGLRRVLDGLGVAP